jgi:hypothetical protein
VPGRFLDGAKVSANGGQVATKLARVRHAVLPDLFYDGVFHLSDSNNSSGEQISGQT